MNVSSSLAQSVLLRLLNFQSRSASPFAISASRRPKSSAHGGENHTILWGYTGKTGNQGSKPANFSAQTFGILPVSAALGQTTLLKS